MDLRVKSPTKHTSRWLNDDLELLATNYLCMKDYLGATLYFNLLMTVVENLLAVFTL